jgi:hypothetical protein
MESTKVVVARTVAPSAFSSARTGAWAGQAAPAEVLAATGQARLSISMTFCEACFAAARPTGDGVAALTAVRGWATKDVVRITAAPVT